MYPGKFRRRLETYNVFLDLLTSIGSSSRIILQVAAPLTRLTCKDKLEWGPQAERAFQDLKTAFTTAPILVHPNFAKAFYLDIDASDFALGAVLSQMGVDEKLHPVAFYSRKFSAAEINYEIHDKEFLAIVDSFQEWRHFLEGATHPVTVYTNHKNLKYFMSARVLNRRQARWNISECHPDR